MVKKTIIPWEELLLNIQYGKSFPKIDYIIALARGGLVPATLLSYKLKTNNLLTITTELYDPATNELNQNIRIKYPLSSQDISRLTNAKNILVVDDILDTGTTLLAVQEYLKNVIPDCPQIHFFTICKKASALQKVPDLYNSVLSPKIINSDDWIVFPWDEEYLEYTDYRDISNQGSNNG